MESLKMWNKKESNEKTNVEFKIHIRKEYNELQKVGALTIQQSNITPQLNNVQEPVNTQNLSKKNSNEL